jgi:hypothetical protein
MCGKIIQDMVRNDNITERLGVAPVDCVLRRVDQMEGSQITRGRERPRKTIRLTIKKDLEINELDRNMFYDRTLCRLAFNLSPILLPLKFSFNTSVLGISIFS